jgi:hypothetical protein
MDKGKKEAEMRCPYYQTNCMPHLRTKLSQCQYCEHNPDRADHERAGKTEDKAN